jgi:toxin HigB-1
VKDKFVTGSFRCPDTERLFRRENIHRLRSIKRQPLSKLDMLAAARGFGTLAGLPGNRLELLKGDRRDQWSTASTSKSWS